jgi:hypothetical protein
MSAADLITFDAPGGGCIAIFRMPGYGEWSCTVVEPAADGAEIAASNIGSLL